MKKLNEIINIIRQLKSKVREFMGYLPLKNLALGGIIFIGGVYLSYSLLVAAPSLRLKPMKAQLEAERKLLEARIKDIGRISQINSELEKAKVDLRKREDRFVGEDELSDFFAKIRNIVEKNNSELVNLSVKPAEPAGGSVEAKEEANPLYQKVPVILSIRGNYVDVLLAITDLMQGETLVEMSDVKIEPDPEVPYKMVANFVLKFYQVDKKQVK